jgi:hypothetical protein
MNYTLINAAKRFKGCITTPASSLVMGYDPTQLLFGKRASGRGREAREIFKEVDSNHLLSVSEYASPEYLITFQLYPF